MLERTVKISCTTSKGGACSPLNSYSSSDDYSAAVSRHPPFPFFFPVALQDPSEQRRIASAGQRKLGDLPLFGHVQGVRDAVSNEKLFPLIFTLSRIPTIANDRINGGERRQKRLMYRPGACKNSSQTYFHHTYCKVCPAKWLRI